MHVIYINYAKLSTVNLYQYKFIVLMRAYVGI